MKIDWKKAIGLTAAVSMLVPLAACGGSSDGGDKNASGSTEAVTLSVWAPQEDQAKDTNWLGKVEENFAKAHPEYNITWKNDVVSEGDASKQVSTDPSAAADVYMFASDQLGVLMDAKAIGQLGTDAEKQVKEQKRPRSRLRHRHRWQALWRAVHRQHVVHVLQQVQDHRG